MTARWFRQALRAVALVALAACVAPVPQVAERGPSAEEVALALEALSRGTTRGHRDHWAALLAEAVAKDSYRCLPPVQRVLSPPSAPAPTRRIEGRLPHYGWYYGPMLYRVGTAVHEGALVWRVMLNVALTPASTEGSMELPDCGLRGRVQGAMTCEGVPYEQAPGVEACPQSGRFEASACRHNQRALVARWSQRVEDYYNRDARNFQLPVRYEFNIFLADDSGAAVQPIDLRLPLWLDCGRTPYFVALRSGWSIPIVAHELGHYLGLLDEYEALSGIFSFYPKTPFSGSEGSRMGLSMKTHTRLLPVHHYLALRRFHCQEPESRDPYRGLLEQRW